MKKKPKIIAVFIAYYAEKTLEQFWKEFPKQYFDECILIDDLSKDNTFKIAQKLSGLKAYQNPVNLGYGGNLKRAISLALEHGADIIVDIHPDNEYKPSAIPLALKKIRKEGCELVLGNRFTSVGTPLKSGMYLWKALPLLVLSYIDRVVLDLNISDFHQGFRTYTRKLFEKVNFEANVNNFLFSFELIAQSAFNNVRIAEVPVETSYTGEKRGATLKHSVRYSLGTFKILGLYLLAKIGIKAKIFQKPKRSLKSRISQFF
jgi:glycosyltransferase involved in cell wall biosynthesis